MIRRFFTYLKVSPPPHTQSVVDDRQRHGAVSRRCYTPYNIVEPRRVHCLYCRTDTTRPFDHIVFIKSCFHSDNRAALLGT